MFIYIQRCSQWPKCSRSANTLSSSTCTSRAALDSAKRYSRTAKNSSTSFSTDSAAASYLKWNPPLQLPTRKQVTPTRPVEIACTSTCAAQSNRVVRLGVLPVVTTRSFGLTLTSSCVVNVFMNAWCTTRPAATSGKNIVSSANACWLRSSIQRTSSFISAIDKARSSGYDL